MAAVLDYYRNTKVSSNLLRTRSSELLKGDAFTAQSESPARRAEQHNGSRQRRQRETRKESERGIQRGLGEEKEKEREKSGSARERVRERKREIK